MRDPVQYARTALLDTAAAAGKDDTRPSLPALEWDASTHYRGGVTETIAYVITLDAINFGSGYFPHLLKRPGHSGYFTIALSLKERFEAEGPFSPNELRQFDAQRVCRTLGQDLDDPVRKELMEHFAGALADLGAFLEQRYGEASGKEAFTALVTEADAFAQRLARLLALMPYFRDVAQYRGKEIPLMKRAQITASDLALALPEAPEVDFGDLDDLTIFADNLVPHVLRLDGVLEYSDELSGSLERGELLPAGSQQEVEIRAVALHAVELMARGLRDDGVDVAPRELDILIWNRGQAARYRGGSKHRTRTVYY